MGIGRKGKKNTRRKKQFNKLLIEQESFIRNKIASYKTNVMKTGSSLHDDVMTTNDTTSVSGKQLDIANQCNEAQEDQDETLRDISSSNTQNNSSTPTEITFEHELVQSSKSSYQEMNIPSFANTLEDVPEFESKLIQRLIHQKLDEMRQGDLYMEGLNQEYYEGILKNRDVYSKFVGILGDTWMIVEGAKIGRKGKKNTRRKKQFNKLLHEQESFIRNEIASYKTEIAYYKTNVMKTGSSLHDDVMTTNDATSVSGKQLDIANQCSEVQEDQDETLEHLSTSNTQIKDL